MMRRLVPIVVALVCAVLVAVPLAAFFEHDACADAGGVYVAATGGCMLEPGTPYVPLFSRPSLYALWFIVLALVAAPAGLAAWLSHLLLARISGRAGGSSSRRASEG